MADAGQVTVTNTVTNTNTNTNTIVDSQLEPGHYNRVMVEIDEIIDNGGITGSNGAGESHMHVSDVVFRPAVDNHPDQMIYCSYTFGVVDVSNPASGSLQLQGFRHLPVTGTREPGCIHLVPDEDDSDIIYTTHHGNYDDGDAFLSGWDLGSYAPDPKDPDDMDYAPVQLPMLQEPGVSYEGLDFENGRIFVAMHTAGLAVFRRLPADNSLVRETTFQGSLTNAWDVHVVGNLAYVGDDPGRVVVIDVSNPLAPVELGSVAVEGTVNDIEVAGALAYVAAKSGGVSIVDVSDPAAPAVVSNIETYNSAIKVAYSEGYLAVANWNDTRIYDVRDPANPVIAAVERQATPKAYAEDQDEYGLRPDITARILATELVGNVVYVGNWWYNFTYQFNPVFTAPSLFLPETVNYLGFPGELAPGESSSIELEARNDGNAPLTIYDVWMDNPAFSVAPEEMLLQPGETGVFTLTFTASTGVTETITTYPKPEFSFEESGLLHIRSDDPVWPERTAYVVGNPPGIGIGDEMPETTGDLVDGGTWSYNADAKGDVTLLAYFATY